MAKMLVAGRDCENCVHADIKESGDVFCHHRNKKYFYGQYVPCDDKEEREDED